MFAAAAAVRIPLQRKAYRVTALLHRRLLEQLVYDNLVARFEEALDATRATRARSAPHQAICFVDLSGFTARTESLGDDEAASVGSALTEIAQAQSTIHRGSLVKPLGDGAMLRFARPGDAVRGALGVVNGARERKLPPARAGIAEGPVIMQDGDYYGRTVNRASGLLGVAQPKQVLVTAEIAETVAGGEVRFTDVGIVRLRGVAEEVRAFAAAMG
jgi:class 3 adenylate cyclase